jgi:hypothetical protein
MRMSMPTPLFDDEDLTITRRGLMHLVATVATAMYAAKRPLLAKNADEVPVANASVEVQSDPTRLELFLKSRGIQPAHLSRESGYSRMYLLRVRLGRQQPTREFMVHITRACRRLCREPILPRDLFHLNPDDERSIMRLYERIDAEERALYEA